MRREEVRGHLDAGHDLIPLHAWDATSAEGRPLGKAPAHKRWVDRQYTKAQLSAAARAGANLGVRLTPEQLVIDYDPRNDPEGAGWVALERLVGRAWLESCPRVNTGGGGLHLYCRKPADELLRNELPGAPGVELKSAGRQVVAAGSRHPSGGWYEWDELSPSPGREPDAPAELLRAARREAPSASSEPGQLSPESLERLLSALDPTDFRDHDAWLRVGMASHHATAGAGLEQFVAWSTSDPCYPDADGEIRSRWPTWESRGESAVTMGTLMHLAHEAGADTSWVALELLDELPEPPAAEKPRHAGPLKQILDLNDRFALVPEGSQVFVYRVESGVPTRMRVGAFRDLLANQFFETPEGKMIPLPVAWMQSPKRRTYNGVVFRPETETPGLLNTWTGWATEPREGEWSLLRELVEDVLCGGDAEAADYVFSWCAHMVQRPWEPAEVAVVIQGPRGTGKSTLGRALQRIAGNHSRSISHGLTEKFNAHLRETVLLVANEAFFAGDKRAESRLKEMITEPEILYEPKGVDPSMARNHLHVLMLSNEEWVVPAGLDERRFLALEVRARRSPDWWSRLHREMDEGGVEAFMHFLVARDIAGWHPRQRVPQTRTLARQKLDSLDALDLAWLEILREGRLPAEGDDAPEWVDGPVRVGRDTIRAIFRAELRGGWAGTQRALSTRLGNRLKSRVPGLRSDPRTRDYLVPALQECREAFERQLGARVDWDE